MSDEINCIGEYRGIGLHDCQSAERIETVVKPAIDQVFLLTDADALASYAQDITRPPEARLFAAAKLRATFEMAVNNRERRPALIDLAHIGALVPALDSRRWRCPRGYGSLLDTPSAPGCPGHAERPAEYREQVEADRQRAMDEERQNRTAGDRHENPG